MTFITILKVYDPWLQGTEGVVVLTDSAVAIKENRTHHKIHTSQKIMDVGNCLVAACGDSEIIDLGLRNIKRDIQNPTATSIVDYLRSNGLHKDANFHVVGQVEGHLEIVSAGESAYQGRNYVFDGSGAITLRDRNRNIIFNSEFDTEILTDITDALIKGTRFMKKAEQDNSVDGIIQYGIVTKKDMAIIIPWTSLYSTQPVERKLFEWINTPQTKSKLLDTDLGHPIYRTNLEMYYAFTSDIKNLERVISRLETTESDTDDEFETHQYLEQHRQAVRETRDILRQGIHALLTGDIEAIISYKKARDKIFYRDVKALNGVKS